MTVSTIRVTALLRVKDASTLACQGCEHSNRTMSVNDSSASHSQSLAAYCIIRCMGIASSTCNECPASYRPLRYLLAYHDATYATDPCIHSYTYIWRKELNVQKKKWR